MKIVSQTGKLAKVPSLTASPALLLPPQVTQHLISKGNEASKKQRGVWEREKFIWTSNSKHEKTFCSTFFLARFPFFLLDSPPRITCDITTFSADHLSRNASIFASFFSAEWRHDASDRV
jgi:hypothetical protein